MGQNKKKHRRRGAYIGDITREIARAKAASRVHGPFMATCTACGERYWPDHREEHQLHCKPPNIHTLRFKSHRHVSQRGSDGGR
jgi:hypothetical protein